MNKKIRVGILFGGKSAEHEVSLQSAKNIIEAIDKDKYEIVLIGIDKEGHWLLNDSKMFLLNDDNPNLIKLNKSSEKLALVPGDRQKQIMDISKNNYIESLDVIFPVLHGPFGEDGTIQGLLKLTNTPFVGAGVLGSAIGMDKDVMKRLMRDAGLPIAKFISITRFQRKNINFDDIVKQVGFPFFVKPANLGSSVGINMVADENDFLDAVDEALMYDSKIVIEEYIRGEEVECSVLGNEEPVSSLPGRVKANDEKHAFYSYNAKYIDEKGASLEIPANLPEDIVKQFQKLAVETFKVLCCEGMARIDFFLKKNNEIIINEINTIPGFTKISMYPKLWEVSDISYTELIDRLIQLAIDRNEHDKKLATSFKPFNRLDHE